jgi:hypothetical protein
VYHDSALRIKKEKECGLAIYTVFEEVIVVI